MAAAHGPQSANVPEQKGFLGWLNKRLPVQEFISSQLTVALRPDLSNESVTYTPGFGRNIN